MQQIKALPGLGVQRLLKANLINRPGGCATLADAAKATGNPQQIHPKNSHEG